MPVGVVTSADAWAAVARPRILRFTGARCAPCRASKPAYEAAAATPDLSVWASFWECDAEAHPDLAAAYGVRTIPGLFVEAASGRITQIVGALPLDRLLTRLREARDRA